MQVKTNGGALATAAILAAVLSWVNVGDGKPPTDPHRAVAAAPVAVRQTVTPAISAEPNTAAAGLPASGPPAPGAPLHSLDSYILEGLRGAATYLVLFILLHLGLRRLSVSGRWAYAGIGAGSALLCVVSQVTPASWGILQEEGRVSMMLGVALIAGAIMGFVYQWRAGLEADGDDPELLRRALREGADAEGPAVSRDRALVDTAGAQYFSGPLQVRTAPPVAFVASLLTGGLFALVKAIFATQGELFLRLHNGHALSLAQVFEAANSGQPLYELLAFGLFGPVLFTAVVLVGHSILRAMNRTSTLAYLIMGGLSPLVLMLALGPLGLIMGLQAVLPLAAAMGFYRSMAGLEPKRVKEDIRFTETRDLVSEDHERRTFGRLIRN